MNGSSIFAVAFSLFACSVAAQTTPYPALHVPARDIPVPDCVSPELQKVLATPTAKIGPIPTTNAGWIRFSGDPAEAAKHIAAMCTRFEVRMGRQVIGGVPCFVLTPKTIPAANRNRLLMFLHGGGFVLYPGEAGTLEGILVASFTHTQVVAVDYRIPPDFPYPAAIDDAMAVWKALAATHDPAKMGIFGSSAGGELILCLIQRAIKEGLPLPAAIAPGTPASDLSQTGDSYFTNEGIDHGRYKGYLEEMRKQYAGALDPKDPRISPIYGEFAGFPPTILTSGTRDLLLSCTVRVNQKLRAAGVETRLQVIEGMGHVTYFNPDIPESKLVFAEIAQFLDRYLGH